MPHPAARSADAILASTRGALASATPALAQGASGIDPYTVREFTLGGIFFETVSL
jgi:hypothetical protein